MLDFVRAFPRGDMGGVAAALTKMGFTKDMTDAEAERFAKQLQEVLEAVEDVDPNQLANGVVDDSSLNRLVASVGEVADAARGDQAEAQAEVANRRRRVFATSA